MKLKWLDDRKPFNSVKVYMDIFEWDEVEAENS